DLRLAKPRGVRGNAEGARHRQLASAAERKSVDGGDDRLAERFDQIEHALARERAPPGAVGRVLRQLVDVGASDKRLLTGAGENYAMDLIVVLKGNEGLAKLVERPRVQRVEALRPLDRENGNAWLTFDE